MLENIWSALGGPQALLSRLREEGIGSLPSHYAVTDFATASIASAGLALAEFSILRGHPVESVAVDRRLSSFWFAKSIRPLDWSLPPQWDPIAGNYRTRDGWIRLHTNAARHRQACLQVLRCNPAPEHVARAVKDWSAQELQESIIDAGGVAAEMLVFDAWQAHPQGRAVAEEALCLWQVHKGAQLREFGTNLRPLQGLRILDLTRILAGPVATRFLAAYGAHVLRIDPPDWDEPAVLPEVTVGKYRARLDLRAKEDRKIFANLLSSADVLVHGYRSDALDRLGFGTSERASLNPNLIDIALNAFGWSGPWSRRRGFDTVVQMSTGLAEAEMRFSGAERPQQLPVQALDYGTGHMMAAAVLRGLSEALQGQIITSRFSLARTAWFLQGFHNADAPELAPGSDSDLQDNIEKTVWGDARRLKPPLQVGSIPFSFDRAAGWLGSDAPSFVL